LRAIIDIQLNDNTKARLIDSDFDNKFVPNDGKPIRAQHAIYEYLKHKYGV
jgi:polyphosphate kinase